MGKIMLKPRWEMWENECLEAAFNQKIQYKIMGAALGRSASSINKRISTLGLRPSNSGYGKMREQPLLISKRTKIPQDLTKMIEILKTFAPLKCFQKGELALRNGFWTCGESRLGFEPHKEMLFESIEYVPIAYSFIKPLDFIPADYSFAAHDRAKKICGDPAYVPLYYIERWAVAKGFHKTTGVLQKQGLSYWKDGTYFSQTQLLMYVNQLRFKHHLQPIVLLEEEKDQET